MVDDALRRVARWARLRGHQAELAKRRRWLDSATGRDFDRARAAYIDALLCTDPLHCDHVGQL